MRFRKQRERVSSAISMGPDWVDSAIEDDYLRAVGVIDPDQPSPWSHWAWQQGALARRDARRCLDAALDSSLPPRKEGRTQWVTR